MSESIICCVCDNEFAWSYGEQKFFARKGFSKPRRCKTCRQSTSTPQVSITSTQASAAIFSSSSLNKPLLSVETQHVQENHLTRESLAKGKAAKIKATESASIYKVVFVGIIPTAFLALYALYQQVDFTPFFYVIATVVVCFSSVIMIDLSTAPDENEVWQDEGLASGAKGEDLVLGKLETFSKNMIIFNQREIPSIVSSKKPTEIDFILVHERGVSILEVKHLKGHISGLEKDNELRQEKLSSGNYLYDNPIKNPVKQLNWQIRELRRYLKLKSFNVQVDGFVVLSHPDSKLDIKDRQKIITFDELDESNLKGGNALNPKVIRAIEQVLSQL